MSGDIQVKKRKDKRKKKAQLEALSREEYREERAIFGTSRTVHDEFLPAAEEESSDHDTEPLVPDLPSEGSNVCAKLVFALLLVILGVASGIIFLELGETNLGFQPSTEQYFEPPVVETEIYEEIRYEEQNPPPVDSQEEPETIDASPRVAGSLNIAEELPETVSEPEDKSDFQPRSGPLKKDVTVPVKVVTTVVTEVVTEVVTQPVAVVYTTVGAESAETAQAVAETAETPVVEEAFVKTEAFTVGQPGNTPEIEEIVPARPQDSLNEVEEQAELQNDVQITPEELPQSQDEPKAIPEIQEIQIEDVPEIAEETPEEEITAEEIEQPAEDLIQEGVRVVEEAQTATESPTLAGKAAQETESHEVAEEQVQVSEEPESFVNQAEREAVEDAVSELWLLARRAQDEATSLRSSGKLESTIALSDRAMMIIEALQERARVVIDTANDGQFEQLLENVAEIERHFRNILEGLESARDAERERYDTPGDNEIPAEEVEIVTDDQEKEELLPEELPQAQNIHPKVEEELKLEKAPEIFENDEAISSPSPAEASVASRGDQPAETSEAEVEVSSTPAPPQPTVDEKLDEADDILENKSALEALSKYSDILIWYPDNARALFGRARALDKLSTKERSNSRLEQAIFAYRAVIDLEDKADDTLYRQAGEKCVERMRFRGFHGKAIRVQQRLIQRFPDDLELRNQLAVQCLLAGQPESAKEVLEETLKRWPDSGFAKTHYGFVLKTHVLDNKKAIGYLSEGIASRETGVTDGRFYFHLGDALVREGRKEEAMKIYEDGVKEGLFLSKYQRSLYNVDRLKAKPWWTPEETTYASFFRVLEAHWQEIRDEGLALLNDKNPPAFKDEAENLLDNGDWKQYELFARGQKVASHCNRAPRTCALVETFAPAASCRRGQIKFSIVHPGTHVWAHTGPTNCRLRAHLGLIVPKGEIALRVAEETKRWEEGKFLVFDDSFEHEVWHNGSSYRLVLIVDVWHPELTELERKSLSAI